MREAAGHAERLCRRGDIAAIDPLTEAGLDPKTGRPGGSHPNAAANARDAFHRLRSTLMQLANPDSSSSNMLPLQIACSMHCCVNKG